MNTIQRAPVTQNTTITGQRPAGQSDIADKEKTDEGWQITDRIFISRSSARKIIRATAGLAAAAMGAFVNANAGTESGIIEGADLKGDGTKYRLCRNLLPTAVSVAGAILSGSAGTLAAYLGSTALWHTQEEHLQNSVTEEVSKSVHRVLGEKEADRSTAGRIRDGLIGGVVGFARGGLTGGKEWFNEGMKYGDKLADKLFARIA
jgi:hypothetical protein